ncbi:MAG: hypothetical protein HFF50_03650 [Lawsonibacter sp.]|nr:hypothetical protein [Lawsonibacter sp.]
MLKKLTSVMLVLALFTSMINPILAANIYSGNAVEKCTVVTSDNSYMEITVNSGRGLAGEESFTIKQFINGELVQAVTGEPNGAVLLVQDYQKGKVVKETVRNVSDIIAKTTNETIHYAPYAANGIGNKVSTITYNKDVYTGREEKVDVYYLLEDSDIESYTINAIAEDTIAILAGALAGFLAGLFLKQVEAVSVAQEAVMSIVSSFGGSVAGEAIGVKFSETVAVNAYKYKFTGRDSSSGRYTDSVYGYARQVVTKKSKSYLKWFYDYATPTTWKNDDNLAYDFWADLFNYLHYPGVKRYA